MHDPRRVQGKRSRESHNELSQSDNPTKFSRWVKLGDRRDTLLKVPEEQVRRENSATKEQKLSRAALDGQDRPEQLDVSRSDRSPPFVVFSGLVDGRDQRLCELIGTPWESHLLSFV